MKRRIIKQGHNALTITLPTDWAKKLNLKAGDEIDLIEKQDQLVVGAKENNKPKSCTIDIENVPVPMLWRFICGAYRAGYDEIKIVFNPNKQYKDAYHYYTTQFDYAKLGEKISKRPPLVMLQSLVDRFVGIEIIETGENFCIVREMGEVTTKEFDNSLRRIFLVIMQVSDRIIETIKKDEVGRKDLCKEIHTIDLNIDRFVDYCCRMLNKLNNSFPDHKKSILFSTLFLLELLGDEFKYIGKHIALSKKSVKETLELAEMVKKHIDLYYDLFYKFDREKVIKFGEHDQELYEYHFRTKETFKGEGRSIAKHFMTLSKLLLALTELRIEMEYY